MLMNQSKQKFAIDFSSKPNLFRLLFGLLAAYLIGITVYNFYQFASIPTDENWFQTTPSKFYISRTIPALRIERSLEKSTSIPDSIAVGNLVLAIDGNWVMKYSTMDQFRKAIPVRPVFSITIAPLSQRKNKIEYIVDRSALPDTFVRVLPITAHVFDVIKGGASDRAGMKIGDLIVRINGKTFQDIYEADRIMRRARAGKTIDYDVIRNNRIITLHVTLARIGFETSLLIPLICGLVLMGFAIFIGMKSPRLKAARLVGLALLAFGFFITAVGKQPVSKNLFLFIRQVSVYACFGMGLAWWMDSAFFFPKEWTEILKRKWVRIVPYAFGASAFIILSSLFFKFGAIVTRITDFFIIGALIYSAFIHVIFRKERPKELKRLSRVIARTIYIGYAAIAIVVLILQYYKLEKLNNYRLLFILLIPLAYLYTIGRYRLLGINLRVRKNIQYSFLSAAWSLIVSSMFIATLVKLLSLNIAVPRFRLTWTSFEILEGSMTPQRQDFIEKALVVIGSIFLGFILWRIRVWGQRFINRKYYRAQLDYQYFSREMAEVMATRLGIVELARGIIQRLTELMNLKRCGMLFFRDGETCCYQAAYGFNGAESEEFFLEIDQKFVKFLYNFRMDSRLSVESLPDQVRTYLYQNGFRHVIPIWFKKKLNGTLLIGERLSEAPFHAEELSFFMTIARQASISIENAFLYKQLAEKERLKHELEIARRIQLTSLPQTAPKMLGMDISGISIPATEVGGDYFDYLNGVPHTITVIVGDVSGKGTSAALYLFKIQGILRSLYQFGLTPRQLFIRANQLLYKDMEKSSFVTAIAALFDTQHHRVALARAGHLPLFYYSAKRRQVEILTPKGLGLGLDKQEIFSSEIEEKVIEYDMQDIFVFITDGIIEAKNQQGSEFGEENLIAVLEKNNSENAQNIRDQIIAEVNRFSMNTWQHDDQTVVVVKAD